MTTRSPSSWIARIAGAAVATFALSCGGAAFTAGVDADAGGGAEAGACASPTVGGVSCLTLQQLPKPPHPGYDRASGAADLGIDGVGSITVFVFDKDPADPSAQLTLQHYPLGGTLSIDQLPVTFPVALGGSSTPYSIYVAFQDAAVVRGTLASEILPGDFVTALTYDLNVKAGYPTAIVPSGAVVPLTLTLTPARGLDVTITADDPLKTAAKSLSSGIHGDGPVLLLVYASNPNAAPIDVIVVPCVDFKLPTGNPATFTKRLATVADGTRSVSAVVFDYGFSGAKPEPGTEYSAPSSFTFAGSWLTNVDISLTANTTPPPTQDNVHCPP